MVYADVELINGGDMTLFGRDYLDEDEIRRLKVKILVNSGSMMLSINESLREALGLEIIDHRPSQYADGRIAVLPVAGPIQVRYAGRFCTTNAIVLPDDMEPLLGAIPMEEMDLWINPARNVLTPLHPEGPLMMMK